VRERGRLRVPVSLSVGHVERPEDDLVLQVLRRRPAIDLDTAQVGAAAALPPSAAASALDRLVRAGLVRGGLVSGRERYGLP
jgi:predicted transcriptional regulator